MDIVSQLPKQLDTSTMSATAPPPALVVVAEGKSKSNGEKGGARSQASEPVERTLQIQEIEAEEYDENRQVVAEVSKQERK
jgi:hypothetical protein